MSLHPNAAIPAAPAVAEVEALLPRKLLSLWRGDILMPAGSFTMREIVARVAELRGVSVEDLRGPRRFSRYVRPRQEAMWVMVEARRWSLPQIGRFFGRHHTTVLHAWRAHGRLLAKAEAEAA